jgi:hypothetical protein
MAEERKYKGGGGSAGLAGVIWFIGWLFTWSFGSLVWWKILVGIIAWPYFLGEVVRHIVS